MSATLYWRPHVPPEGAHLGDALKFKLRERYDLMNGSFRLSGYDRPYLEGLRDGGVEDADRLLAALDKHGEVEVWLES